jgi:subtilase family serine protease
MRSWKFLLPLLASTLSFAAQQDRITGPIDSSQMAVLPGHVSRGVSPQNDQGPLPASFQFDHATLLTLPTPAQQRALKLLVAEQQDPKSPNFHKWLTPEQWADRFGLSQNDVLNISGWLKSQGLTVISVARGRNWFVFSGTAAQVENAFRIQIHRYNVNGEMHFATATMPSIPAALSGIAAGVRGLDDFRPRPMHVRASPRRPNYYDNSFPGTNDFLAPADIATIYDLGPLYTAGFDGTGQKLAIIGETDVYLDDLNAFRTGFGLPLISGCTTNASGLITACNTSNFKYVLNGPDPGVSLGDLTESDLDLEWSAATAPGAQIIFVNTAFSTDVHGGGVFDSYYYAIDNDLAPVISMSYGYPCEFADNNLPTDEIELTKANSLGITFMNSSGDSGAASCDPGPDTPSDNLAVYGLAVSYPASSPEITAVGGTAVSYPNGFSSTYWSTTNGTNGGTAQNPPLPETSWNDDVELGTAYGQGTPLAVQESYGIIGSGGGASNCAVQSDDFSNCASGFPQPSWQTVTVPGQTNHVRLVPDVSLIASPYFPGYIYCTPVEELSTKSPYNTESTSSCGTGAAGDITAAINGLPVGDPTTVGPSVVGGTSASSPIFAAMVAILNQYLGTSGLGNINPTLYTLAKDTSSGAFHQINSGDNIVYCEGGQPPAPWPPALQCPGASGTTGSFGYDAATADTATGYNLVTGLGSVDANKLAIAWKASLGPAADFTLTVTNALSPSSVSAGQSAVATLTIAPVNGSTQTINFTPSSCTGQPSGATCSFNPASVTLDGTDSETVTLTIATSPNMAASGPQTITITGTASGTGGESHTATVSLTVTATTETFSLASTNGATFPVTVGGNASVSITVNGTNGFIVGTGAGATTALPLTYTCTGSPVLATAEIACTVSPGNGQPTNATAITVSLVTTAPTAQLRPARGSRIFYALLLPGLFGIVLVAGSRTRGLRLLTLIVVLGFSTLWLGACSGGGGSTNTQPKNPGTPTGTYTVTIGATTGGASAITNSNAPFTIQLVVN